MTEQRPPIALPDPPLSDGVVVLRPWRRADIDAIVELCSEELAARYTTVPSPYHRSDAEDWLAAQPARMRAGESAFFAITTADDDTAVGSIGVHVHAPGLGEAGYILGAAHRGRGLMPRSVDLLAEWSFAELGIERLQLTTHLDNTSSQRVAEKCGFRREGVLRRYGLQRGQRVDLVMFAKLNSD
jgi:RimJ/RimL family protein N-acetyltransferase